MNEPKSEEPDSVQEQQQLPLPLVHEVKDRVEANARRAAQLKAERDKDKKASAG
jgi:hypothetical protein